MEHNQSAGYWQPVNWISFGCSRVEFRITRLAKPVNRLREFHLWTTTGQPVMTSGKPNLHISFSALKPDSWFLYPEIHICVAALCLVTGFELFLLHFSFLFTCSFSLQNRELLTSIFIQFLFISHPFLCQNQWFKPIPMHFTFIKHFPIIISSLVLHHFIVISHTWIVLLQFSLSLKSTIFFYLINTIHHLKYDHFNWFKITHFTQYLENPNLCILIISNYHFYNVLSL